LAREAETFPDRDASIVAIGIHPFVIGTPDGAEALGRVLENFKRQKLGWVTDFKRSWTLRARSSSCGPKISTNMATTLPIKRGWIGRGSGNR
jgi:hypothetical protein